MFGGGGGGFSTCVLDHSGSEPFVELKRNTIQIEQLQFPVTITAGQAARVTGAA